MKHILILLAAIALAILISPTGHTQTLAKDSTLTYTCILHDAQFVAGSMPSGSPIVDAITWATEGVTDSAASVHVVVTQGDLVSVAQNSRNLSEGTASEVNARLYSNVLGLLAGRPWLLQQMLAIKAANQQGTSAVVDRGATMINAKRVASNRQQ